MGHRYLGAATGRRQRRGDVHAGLAPAALLGPAGMNDDALGGLVAVGDLGGARELKLDRPHPDRYLAAVLVIAEVLGQCRPRQAGSDPRDVAEEVPDFRYRLGDLEGLVDQHRVSFLR